jgi:hypothetical protein
MYAALTTNTKKLLLIQVHDPPQTIVVYLPHLYPDEGIYSCCTTLSGGEQVSAITWAFGPDGYSAQRMLNTHWIDIDAQEKRLQIYKPRLLPNGQVPAAHLSNNDFRANSYLWLRLVAGEGNSSKTYGGYQGRSMRPSSRGRGWGRAGGVTHIAVAEPKLRVSVDVQRFEPKKQFQHYSKTTKLPISRYEMYVVNSQTHLEPPVMELLDTVEAFLAPSSRTSCKDGEGAGGSDAAIQGQSLVMPAAAASEEQLLDVHCILQQLPGAFLDAEEGSTAAAAASGGGASSSGGRSRVELQRALKPAADPLATPPRLPERGRSSGRGNAPAGPKGMGSTPLGRGVTSSGSREGGVWTAATQTAASAEQKQRQGRRAVQQQGEEVGSLAFVEVAAQQAMDALVQWAVENKLQDAVQLCKQVGSDNTSQAGSLC